VAARNATGHDVLDVAEFQSNLTLAKPRPSVTEALPFRRQAHRSPAVWCAQGYQQPQSGPAPPESGAHRPNLHRLIHGVAVVASIPKSEVELDRWAERLDLLREELPIR